MIVTCNLVLSCLFHVLKPLFVVFRLAAVMSESEAKSSLSTSVENDLKVKEGGNEEFDGSLVEEGELDYDEEEEGELGDGIKQKKKTGVSSDQVEDDNKGEEEEGEIESDGEIKVQRVYFYLFICLVVCVCVSVCLYPE